MNEKNDQPDCPELEEVAALIDGNLEGEARAEMQEHLVVCERCYEVFTETLRFRDEEARGGEVADFAAAAGRPPTGVGLKLAWGALAAAVLGSLVVWTPALDVLTGRGVLTADLPVERLGKHLVSSGGELGSFGGSGWSYSRGTGFALGLNKRERSFRIGVRLVDLEVALRLGDSGAALRLLPEVTDLAGSFEFAEHLEYAYREIARQLDAGQASASQLEASGQVAGFVAETASGEYFALGKWAEAGRLAAKAGDMRFFRQKAVRDFSRRAAGIELPEESRSTLAAIAGRLEAKIDASDLAELSRDFASLTSQAGNL